MSNDCIGIKAVHWRSTEKQKCSIQPFFYAANPFAFGYGNRKKNEGKKNLVSFSDPLEYLKEFTNRGEGERDGQQTLWGFFSLLWGDDGDACERMLYYVIVSINDVAVLKKVYVF